METWDIEDLEIVKSHGNTKILYACGLEDGYFVETNLFGKAPTRLFVGTREKAERTFAYYADGTKDQEYEQDDLFANVG